MFELRWRRTLLIATELVLRLLWLRIRVTHILVAIPMLIGCCESVASSLMLVLKLLLFLHISL